jgi:hypothetical protein
MKDSPERPGFATALAAAPGVRMLNGHLDGVDAEGRLLFRPDGTADTFPVTIGVEVPDGALVKAARTGRRATVLVPQDEADGVTPVLIALLRERVRAEARDAMPGDLEVKVDGETLKLRAENTLELRCGKARLVLRRDGRVVLNGAHIVSSSTGPHRIKGATIALN